MSHSKSLVLGLIVLVVLGLGLFYSMKEKAPAQNEPPKNDTIVCTMDALLCPDGSSVGRVPPSCAFATCPAAFNTTGWKTKIDTDAKVEFKYPESIGKNFISTTDWPPVWRVYNDKLKCTETGTGEARIPETKIISINNNNYCLSKVVDGAAGSTYIEYTYAKQVDNKAVVLTFTLRYPQCDNYNEPSKTICKAERVAFNLDNLVDHIFETLKFI